MHNFPSREITSETNRLLSALDDAIDQSTAMRDIVDRYQRLHNIESLTGPSRITRILRKEIKMMERKFRLGRHARGLEPGTSVFQA